MHDRPSSGRRAYLPPADTALLDAGHEVTYIAPVDSVDFHPERTRPSLQLMAVPRARGRRRTGAIRAARSALSRHAADADLLLIHDPELLLALPAGAGGRR